MSIETLIAKLNELNNIDSLQNEADADDLIYLTNGTEDDHLPLVKEIVSLACGELINSDGTCKWTAHDVLKKAGFRVVAGEKDSFGWITGVIITNKGRIVYG